MCFEEEKIGFEGENLRPGQSRPHHLYFDDKSLSLCQWIQWNRIQVYIAITASNWVCLKYLPAIFGSALSLLFLSKRFVSYLLGHIMYGEELHCKDSASTRCSLLPQLWMTPRSFIYVYLQFYTQLQWLGQNCNIQY